MAYMNQEKKAAIAAALKVVVPKNWKYSLRVNDYLSISMTVSQAPIDLRTAFEFEGDHYEVNPYHFESHCKDQELKEIISLIVDALNTGNWNRSDLMTDYFDVGHYIHLKFGRWNKPFVNNSVNADIRKAA
jgi:hypothetical protein